MKKIFTLLTLALVSIGTAWAADVIGYTEAINGTKLDARVLTGCTNVDISGPIYGSNISDYKGTSKSVSINGTAYANTDSWRKSQNNTYEGQNVGYNLTIAPGYKMNISHVGAKIAVADDTYKWYVEILNGAGTQIWKSGEKTTTKASAGEVGADVTEKEAIQGVTGNITVNLYVKQGGSTKYFSINYLQLTVTTELDTRATYAMSVSQNIDGVGTVTPEDGSTVTEGEDVAFTAIPNTDYKFVKWEIDGVEQTANPYVIENVTSTHTAVAYFAKRYTVTYNLGDAAGTVGKVLNNVNRANGYDEKYSDDNDKYTIPAYAHKYLYKEGYIMDKWEDEDGNLYKSGDVISMTKNIKLTPTWTATTNSLASSTAKTTVTWSFAKADILFTDWQSDTKYGYYVQTANVNGENIAVPMKIINGKVGNWGRTDKLAQVNKNTTFTIPAVKGMVVKIADAYKEISATTIAGSTDYTGKGTKSITYTYDGTDETIDIVSLDDGQYLTSIEVVYPVTASAIPAKIGLKGYATFASNYPLDLANLPAGLTAYKASSVAGGEIKFSEVTAAVPAGEGLLLKGTAGETYSIPVAASANDLVDNKLAGVTVDTPLAADGAYVLSGDKFVKANKGTLKAGKAYLPAVSVSAPVLTISFGETTGINAAKAESVKSADIYNLNGQRVSQPAKGLYIIGGKKVVKR